MACVDRAAVVQVVVQAFRSRFNAAFPPAYEEEKKRQMVAAFDGRQVSVSAESEWWTGSFYSDPEWVNPVNGSHVVWHGERKRGQVRSATLACDGNSIAIADIEVDVEQIGTMEDYYERQSGDERGTL
ncbi:MAG: hypothetical protein J1E42_07735 [Akkermansiaceae bacterium]|nr:hypothetical protein [Akkermansiaceae bacterium]